MQDISLADLETATHIACGPDSDLHHLPFSVTPMQLATAMISTADSPVAQNVTKSTHSQKALAKVDLEDDNYQGLENPLTSLEGQ